MIKKVAATAMVGSIVALKFSHIIIGRVLVLAPDTKMVTTTSSSEVTNDSNAPVTTEFFTPGKVTLKKAPTGVDPIDMAASSRFASNLAKAADMVRNTIGIASKEWAMIRPRMVLLRPTLAKLAYKATPVITTGTIIGVSIRFKNRFLPLNFSLLTANAAKVPMIVAKTATQIAMNKLRSNDVIHCSFIKNLSYHLKEKLLIG